jgi:filamentous hemagglutinin family protein
MPRIRAMMLAGVSALALIAATPRVEARQLGIGSGLSPVSTQAAALAAAQAAAVRSAQQASTSLKRAAQAIQAMQQLQLQARNAGASAALGQVPNGLVSGGLVPDSGLAANGQANAVTTWTGALTPVQSQNGSQASVNILQTQPKAILNWNSFNVGSSTAVNFLQVDGNGVHTDWVALNRVVDPNAPPSKILGQINAPGSVYLINRNGIIFGGGSQINVTGLVASTLDVGGLGLTQSKRDEFFLNTGIGLGGVDFSVSGSSAGNDFNTTVQGNVQVDAGASINAAINTQDSPNNFLFGVYLFGANVINNGTLTSPAGEVAMVAARTISLTPQSYPAGALPNDPMNPGKTVAFRATGFTTTQYAPVYDQASGTPNPNSSPYLSGTGTVTQGGLVQTPRGTALLSGDKILVSGVISADTSITRNSNVLLDAATSIDVSGTISIQPYENGETLPFLNGPATANTSSVVQPFIPGNVLMGAHNVTMDSTGLVSAPSATVTLTTTARGSPAGPNLDTTVPQRVLMQPGATIDVAGLQDVELPASYNFIAYTPRDTEFADTPLLRDGVLVGKTLWIDIRASGTRSDGSTWLGTPLGNANGFVNKAPQSLDMLMTKGGTVNLATDITQTALRDVVLQPGSLINVAGGYVHYLGGAVPVTRLIGANGRIYSMTNADPNIAYVGIAGQFTVNHPHWGISETYTDPFGSSRFDLGYIEGRDAGGMSVTTINQVLDGNLLFGAVYGERQLANGVQASAALTNGAPSQKTPYELPSQGYLQFNTPASVAIGSGSSETLPQDFTATTPLPQTAFDPIPTDLYTSAAPFRVDLAAAGLSGLSALIITASDLTLTKGSTLDMAWGGRVLLKTAGAMDLQGQIAAHSGQIKLNTDAFGLKPSPDSTSQFYHPSRAGSGFETDIRIGGVLDTSGLWVNDIGKTAPGAATGKAFINGGAISISTNDYSNSGFGIVGIHDYTGSIILAANSVLDASSGGYVGVNGTLSTGKQNSLLSQVPQGSGGNISLAIYQGDQFHNVNDNQSGPVYSDAPNEKYASITIDPLAVMRSYGFTTNGQLSITAPNAIQIGGAQNAGANFWVPTSLFAAGGFSKYTFQTVADGRVSIPDPATGSRSPLHPNTSITLVAGETVNLAQRNFSLHGFDLSQLPTGTNLSQVAPIVTLPDDQRQPTSLNLGADYILLGAGSTIKTDSSASASVTLQGKELNPGVSSGNTGDGLVRSALLLGSIVSHGGSVNVFGQQIWLGSNASIDVSGTFVPNSTFNQKGSYPVSGTLLKGGNVTLGGNVALVVPSTGINNSGVGIDLIGQSGASINLSGAQASLQGAGSAAAVDSWSDGGTLTILMSTVLWDGSFVATAGAPQGNNGTLIIGGGAVYLAPSVTNTKGGNLSAALANLKTTPVQPGDIATVAAASSLQNFVGGIHLTADKLLTPDHGQEFDSIYVSSGTVNPAAYFSSLDPTVTTKPSGAGGTIFIVGGSDWSWSVGQRLYLGAQAIVANTPATNSTFTINAPYVLLTTFGLGGATAGSATLDINGGTIDVESAVFSGFNNVNLNSAGDIQLSTPHVFETKLDPNGTNGATIPANPPTFSGSLNAPNFLSLQAQRIYPVTKVDFTINAGSAGSGTATFTAPAGSDTSIPLSAGGSVTVIAGNINQSGNLFAPLGKITLGDSTAQTVKLGAGSLTSVALDKTVPFGATDDGGNWFYNDNTTPLTLALASANFLPTKVVTLNGQGVTVQSTSTVDVSGGGDLQANEFVAGKGGSVDTLAAKGVYALLPSNSAAVAAFDIDFIYRLGDTQPLAGQQVYLAGGNGIAAGTYTLLPGHYATLPGALRLVDFGSKLANRGLASATLSDGTQIISGYYTQSTNPSGRSSGTELFSVQTNAVWRQYSEIDGTTANSYFYAKSVHDGVNVPYLPMDAGRLAISAQTSLTMNLTARSQAQGNGRPGQLDLSANKIALVDPGQTALPGYVGIDVTQITGFDSVLIGGLRTDLATGTRIDPVASQVEVMNTRAELAAPEIILVASPPASYTAPLNTAFQLVTNGKTSSFNFAMNVSQGDADPTSGGIVLDPGSLMHSTGLTGNTFARNYLTPAAAGEYSAAALAKALGGTLSADGTTITNANLAKLQNNDPTVLSLLRNYAGPQDFGAMLTLTSDPLLSVSNFQASKAGPLAISFNLPSTGATVTGTMQVAGGVGNNAGTIKIGANASVTGQSVTLNATKDTNAITLDPAAIFGVKQISLVARNFGFSNAVNAIKAANGLAPATAVAMSAAMFNRLAAGHNLSLKSFAGGMEFSGDIDLDSQRLSLGVTLDTPYIQNDSGTVTIGSQGTVTLLNGGASAATTTQNAIARKSLTINADEIDLGGGTETIAGFASVALNADTRVFVKNSGALLLGLFDSKGNYTDIYTPGVALTITTPDLLVGARTSSGAGTGSQFLVKTAGDVGVTRPFGAVAQPPATTENGGSLEIDAKSFTLGCTTPGCTRAGGTIQAQAGTLVIHTTGTFVITDPTTGQPVVDTGLGISLGDGAYIAAGGFLQSFFDVAQYLPGGKVTLTADAGAIRAAASSTVDVAQPTDESGNIGLGYGGELDVTATGGSAVLNGKLSGAGSAGHGGTFRLDTQAMGSTLDTLADSLHSGGMNGEIDIHTRQGNLTLSQGHTLQAHTINLVADAAIGADQNGNGNLTIAGTIDARGENSTTLDGASQAGGQVGLWGGSSVDLAPTGKILASTSTTHADERGGDVVIGVGWNAKWDWANKQGGINLEPGSQIDVSGGTKGGLSNGTVKLRAPNDGHDDIMIQQIGSLIRGARSVSVEGYVSFDTNNSGYGINGSSLGWDGTIDPAGWYRNGTLVDGTFSNITGWKLTVTSAGSGLTAPPVVKLLTTADPTVGTPVQTSLKVVAVSMASGKGGEFTQPPTSVTLSAPNNPGTNWSSAGTAATATVSAGLKSVSVSNGPSGVTAGAAVTFLAPTGGTAATGTAIVNAQGQLIGVNIISAGTNYKAAPTQLTVGGKVVTTGIAATYTVVALTLATSGDGYLDNKAIFASATFGASGGSMITAPTITASMGVAINVNQNALGSAAYEVPYAQVTGAGNATLSFTFATNLTGSRTNGVFTIGAAGAGFTLLTSNGIDTGGTGTALFAPSTTATGLNQDHINFYTNVLKQVAQGTWTNNGLSYGLANTNTARLGSYLQPDGKGGTISGAVHLQPGIDLINSSQPVTTPTGTIPAINGGDITVATNWNLAAGTANNLTTQATTQANGNITPVGSYDPANSYISFLYRLGLEPGTLTLQASRDVDMNASISDGFFQFKNYNDPTYLKNLATYINAAASNSFGQSFFLGNRSLSGYALNGVRVQIITNADGSYTYKPVGFTEAPYLASANQVNATDAMLEAADVFPSTLRMFCTSNCGAGTLTSTSNVYAVANPGSWSYRITAGADPGSANPNAIGSTFGANAVGANHGRGSVIMSSHGSYSQLVSAPIPSPSSSNNLVLPTGTTAYQSLIAVNLPTMLRTGTGSINIAAALNLQLTNQGAPTKDGSGVQTPDLAAPGVIYTAGVATAPLSPNLTWTYSNPFASTTSSAGQPRTATASDVTGFFEPRLLMPVNTAFGPVNAAAFPQMGGDITIAVQQDILGFQNVTNPGLATSSAQFYTPWLFSMAQIGLQTSSTYSLKLGAGVFSPSGAVLNEQSAWWIQFGNFDQGVMSVGGNATLTAGRDIRDLSVSLPTTARVSGGLDTTSTPLLHLYGSGNMTVSVGRELDSGTFYEGSGHASILVRGSVNSDWSIGSVAVSSVLAVDSGQIALNAGGSISLSGVVNPAGLRTQAGSTITNNYVMETYGPNSAVRLFADGGDINILAPPNMSALVTASLYPANLEAVAFTGSINLKSGVILADSLSGGFELLADGTISKPVNLSTGASLIDAAFNAFAPNDGFDLGTSLPMLAHRGDNGSNYLYAVTGDILGAPPVVAGVISTVASGNVFMSNRSIAVHAGRDILDLNMVAQNVNSYDVTSVISGRDISYSGLNNFGGLQIAGPGFFMVEAGRDLGPFLPLAFDTAANAKLPEGIQSLGNNGVLNLAGTQRYPVGNGPDVQLFAPPDSGLQGSRNFLLSSSGASITAMFGVAKGVNYQGIIDTYVDPAGAAGVPHNYLDELRKFLAGLGKSTVDQADAWAQFQTLTPQLRQVFADQVYFAELKATGIPDTPSYKQYQRGYQAVNIMFPADVSSNGLYGYTRNDLGGGSNGANTVVHTGNLDLLHATIQTQRGGDISILGPGGSILVGSIATEPNKSLKPSALGILTLAGGGINTFTDQSVLVNASRVMTWFGGDVLMWSSNGDIDAGRGARTTLSFPPLTVNFNPDDLETVDLGGLVSGAGIAVLQTQSFASKSNAYLLAPRGTVDAGDAGIRVSGDISILAVQVVNADNIQVGGKSSGVPTVQAPPVAGLTAANNTAGAGAKTTTPTDEAPKANPSVIIVEVLGYGGGDKTDQTPPASRGGDTDENGRKRNQPNQGDEHQSYNSNGNVRVLGYDTLGESEMTGLTEKEKQAIRN